VFGLLAALQKDISTKTLFDGHSPQYFPQFADSSSKDRFIAKGGVKNFGNFNGEQFGKIDLRKATAHSVNTVFAQLNIKLADGGTKASGVMDAAILAGLPKNTPGLGTNMSNILGTASPHAIDMANAYATIAAQGEKATPYLISRVRSADGSIDYKVKKKLTPAFDKKVTADVTDAMTRVVTEGTGTGALALGRPAAGKTGTTTNTEAVWFDGFTPQLSAAVGIYKNTGHDPVTVKNGHLISSGGIPVDIWTAFMEGALKGQKVLDFPPRAGLGDSSVPTPTPTPTPTTTTTAPTTAPTTPPTTVTTTAPPATKGPGPPTLPVPSTTVP
jgi:membrane peptidoglycan carboxypeptidase